MVETNTSGLLEKPYDNVARLAIIDGHAYAYRSFYAIRGKLQTPDGKPANAIYGFVKTMGKLQRTLKPTHWAVVWDGGMDAARLALLSGYKAQRPPMPLALAEQLSGMQDYLKAAQIASFQEAGVEADDLIAALTHSAVGRGMPVIIVSPDKDFMQLVSDRVGIWSFQDEGGCIIGKEEVRRKTGVDPHQIVDWLSLVGDQADNIPGVPGVGPVIASKLLNQFGSATNVFAAVDQVKPASLQERLRHSREIVSRNQEMIRLKADKKDNFNWEILAVKSPNAASLKRLYQYWGFNSLLGELKENQLCQAELF